MVLDIVCACCRTSAICCKLGQMLAGTDVSWDRCKLGQMVSVAIILTYYVVYHIIGYVV